MSRLTTEQKATVLGALLEGTSIRATERMTGVSKKRILQLVLDMGAASERLMDDTIRGLRCEQVEMDEVWMFIQKRRSQLKPGDSSEVGDAWLWVSLDPDSKVIPAHHVGKRMLEDAHALTGQLRRRIEGTPQFNTDRLHTYRSAILGKFSEQAADGSWIRPDWGTIVKQFDTVPTAAGRYMPPRCTSSEKRAESGSPDMERVTTSHVESAHLHFRMRNKRAARLGNAFSKSLDHLRAATATYYAHYNLVRRHSSVRTAPAVAAGLIPKPWTLMEFAEWGADCGA